MFFQGGSLKVEHNELSLSILTNSEETWSGPTITTFVITSPEIGMRPLRTKSLLPPVISLNIIPISPIAIKAISTNPTCLVFIWFDLSFVLSVPREHTNCLMSPRAPESLTSPLGIPQESYYDEGYWYSYNVYILNHVFMSIWGKNQTTFWDDFGSHRCQCIILG